MQRASFAGNGKAVLALTALLAAGACDDATGPLTSNIQVLVTDAPHEQLDRWSTAEG